MRDTSETYIKMSEKAAHYLGLPSLDTYLHREDVWEDKGHGIREVVAYKLIPLYRQDQLQEASGLDWRSFDGKCLVYEHPLLVPTKEQAGIRVVMKEKYNKVWVNNEWRNGS